MPLLFAGGAILAGLSLILPTVYFAYKNGWGIGDGEKTPPFWQSFKKAIWGLLAPVIILGGLRAGIFTPTEAAVVASYGLFVSMFVYRTLTMREIYKVLIKSAEISAVVMLIISLAGIFAHASLHADLRLHRVSGQSGAAVSDRAAICDRDRWREDEQLH